jgi:VIT1/CCC1 family predicted Fe2+/Mn2+ transporter
MQRGARHRERHRAGRLGWLRAAVLGANDGIVSTASLLVGVASAEATSEAVLLAGMAGLVAGAMSMAAGEYVSVGSQSDTERADTAKERGELATDWDHEVEELIGIHMERGLDRPLAEQVARALMAKDPLRAHLRDELGIDESTAARPLQAAGASASAFAVGAALPMLVAAFAPRDSMVIAIAAATLVSLAGLGALAARVGGAPPLRGALRVTVWGAAAMGATALVGRLFGVELA